MQKNLPLIPFLYIPSKVPPEGHGLQGLQGGRSPKRLDRIFLFCIFLNLLNPLGLPIPLVALLELEKLTTIGLGCDIGDNKKTAFDTLQLAAVFARTTDLNPTLAVPFETLYLCA